MTDQERNWLPKEETGRGYQLKMTGISDSSDKAWRCYYHVGSEHKLSLLYWKDKKTAIDLAKWLGVQTTGDIIFNDKGFQCLANVKINTDPEEEPEQEYEPPTEQLETKSDKAHRTDKDDVPF
jgi:hypothetical protein